MRTLYRLAVIGLAFRGITACSSDPSATTATVPPASSLGKSRLEPTTEPRPERRQSAPLVELAEDAKTQPSGKGNATRVVALRRFRADYAANKAVPTNSHIADRTDAVRTASAAKPEVVNPQTAVMMSAASIGTGDLPAEDVYSYCASTLAAAQVFWVRPGRDTVLVGNQGTAVAVPASAWVLPTESKKVRLEMQEFYSTPDIVLAGLSTMSGSQMLETGGMVKLTATAEGQPVALRPGQRLLMRMPTTRKLEGMQLFEGVSAAAAHGLDWQLPPGSAQKQAQAQADAEAARLKVLELQKDGRWPKLAANERAFLRYFDGRIPHTKATLVRLRKPRVINPEEKEILRAYSKANHKKVLRVVRVGLKVDSTGVMLPPVLLPNGDAEIGAAVLSAVAALPKWRPARFRQLAAPYRLEKTSAEGILSVLYTSAGKRLIGIEWDELATHIPRIARYVRALASQARQEGQRQFAAQFASAGPMSLDEKLYYELEAGGLGWINCDRFLEPGPRIEYTVNTAQPNTVVTLVFQNQRSILASTRTEATAAVFAEVPAGAAATIVAIRREQGTTFLATAPATVGQEKQPNLDFKAVSLEELRTVLAKL